MHRSRGVHRGRSAARGTCRDTGAGRVYTIHKVSIHKQGSVCRWKAVSAFMRYGCWHYTFKARGARLCGPENWCICTILRSSISRCKIGSAEAIGPLLHTSHTAQRCTLGLSKVGQRRSWSGRWHGRTMARQRSCATRGVLGWWAGGTAAQRTTPWGTSCALHQTLAATQPSSTAHRT